MLARGLNRIILCLQEGLIGDFCDYKQPTNLESMKTEKRLITKPGLITGGLASNTHQKIKKTGLINGISHESEAVENPFLRPVLLRKARGSRQIK